MQQCRRAVAAAGLLSPAPAAAAGRRAAGVRGWLAEGGVCQQQRHRWYSEGSAGEGDSCTGRFWRYLTGRNGAEGSSAKAAAEGGANPASSDAAVVARAGSRSEAVGGASKGEGGATGRGPASGSDGSSSEAASGSGLLVPNNPESRYRQVLAVPLAVRPLFPGGIMPVTVSNNQLIKELVELRRQGAQAYVGAFLRKGSDARAAVAAAGGDLGMPSQEELLGTSEAPADAVVGAEAELEDPSDLLHSVGTFAQVHTIVPTDQGAQLLLLGHRRIERTGLVEKDPLRVSISHLKEQPYNANDDMLRATTMEIISTLKELLHLHPLYNEQMRNFIQFGADFHDLSRLADLATSLTSGDSKALQAVLEQLDVPERANQALVLLKKEVELCKLQADIGKRVEEKINKDQRRYFLMEQLKSIKKELGLEKDEKTALVQKFRERLEPLKEHLPEAAAKVIEEELEKLQAIEPASSEFNVTRNYLDWLTSIPWGQYSQEKLDVAAAKEVLDEDHYGLDDVKDRILEFIAVGKLRGTTQGKILCLVGPPGVGKTSIGRSIARALNRKYYRFSVGGLSDVAEIKGHRRTYVGAMPGKMVQCLKTTQASNPFVLIDEIDKLGRGYQGDPASALLELLDPEQNSGFLDHYLDVPIDLSKVLFMCTANVLDTIPGPLLDRMEVIRLSGYIFDEKVAIARAYLEPQARTDAGVPEGAVRVTDDALAALVDDYAREAGVRNLKKQLEKIYRKAALQLVRMGVVPAAPAEHAAQEAQQVEQAHAEPAAAAEQQQQRQQQHAGVGEHGEHAAPGADHPGSRAAQLAAGAEGAAATAVAEPMIVIDRGDLKEYVGQPPYPADKIYADGTPVGVVMGLAWTALGGSTLYVEAASVERGEGKGSLKATGQLGDVMKESATIAHTYARKFLEGLPAEQLPGGSPGASFFADHAIHLHVPAGATPKDGPSAGCTIITALLSLALNKPALPDLAMTGEVTLTGKVLPIGGVKEKTLAARRSGVKHLVFPEGNRRDWEELTEDVKAGLDPHFVEHYDQIYALAFGQQAQQADTAVAA
ncbi:hypothetical protein ABPG77_005199 [Micractinium sp. CCAP 211/92]